MSGAFSSAALDLHSRGLAVIPVGGADGKHPLVKGWSRWRGQRRETVEHFSNAHPQANVGVLTGGLSRLTVIDCDDENTLADAESRFGKTPLVTRSPRGGGHLWFASSGERNANLRPALNVDVRGIGGFVVAPPSLRPGVGSYRIERGSWDELGNLPAITSGLPNTTLATDTLPASGTSRAATEGRRNSALFTSLLPVASTCASWEAFIDRAKVLNDSFISPLPTAEVERTAGSVWKYKQEGRLMLPGFEGTLMLHAEHEALEPDAFYLLAHLRRCHAGSGKPFPVSAKAMEREQVFSGWGRWKYEKARDSLIAVGLLRIFHKGGRCKGDATTYVLGANYSPLSNRHPSPASPPEIKGDCNA